MSVRARLAIDIGGTFTDFALERDGAALLTHKTLTTSRAPEEGLLAGLDEVLARAGLAPGDLGLIIHGATLATNALIERRGARTALLTTEGHRDSLEMAYENRFEQYDIMIDRPAPLVPRWLRLPVRERMDWRGRALVPLDEESVRAHVPTLLHENVESVAIGFLHAYANIDHERRAADILARALPHLSITLAGEVAPEIREYERLSTAVANAYVRPLIERYLRRLERALVDRGVRAPCLLITSGGGLTTIDAAARFPIRLVESGPAGGAVLAAALARAHGLDRILSFDMGGTTAKLCLIDHGAPKTARAFEIDRSYRFKKGSGLPVRIPVIEMVEIGAGGGSIAKVDALGRLTVGPESAAAAPGPACYGRGGERPTVTDADLALGRIAPDRFVGGSFRLDASLANAALQEHVAAPLGFAGDMAAYAVGEIVDEAMAAAARAHAAEEGADLGARVMIAFGGAAPLHAARLAEKLGVATIVIPAGAGVGSAIGFLLAPVAYDVVRSKPMRLAAFDGDALDDVFADMQKEALGVLSPAAPDESFTESRSASMRYRGQGHEISVRIGAESLSASGAADRLADAFDAAYRAQFGRSIPGVEIELLTLMLSLCGPARTLTPPMPCAPYLCEARSFREVLDSHLGRRKTYGVFERVELPPGAHILGPALIVEDQTTTVVSEVFDARIDGASNLIVYRKNGR